MMGAHASGAGGSRPHAFAAPLHDVAALMVAS
jgi:hypothetical protein